MERIQITEIAHILSPPHLSDVAVMSSCEKVTGIFRKERMFFSLFSSTPNTSFNLHNGPLQLFFDLRRRQGGPICLSSKFLNKLITSEVNWRNSCCNLSGQNAILSTKTFPTRVAFNEQEENNDLNSIIHY